MMIYCDRLIAKGESRSLPVYLIVFQFFLNDAHGPSLLKIFFVYVYISAMNEIANQMPERKKNPLAS